jgi:signal transduction histidine kinase/ActR/RegA family two-component response regulator
MLDVSPIVVIPASASLESTDDNPKLTTSTTQSCLDQDKLNGELRDSEARYRMLFEAIDEGFCIIERMQGLPGEAFDFRYVEANSAFKRQTGIGDVVGQTLRQVLPGECEEWIATYSRVVETGQALRFERGLVSQGRVLELYAFPVGQAKLGRVGVSFRDITERKRLEGETLQQATDLKEQDRRQNEFLAMLGHELRNPLAPIMSAVHLLGLQSDETPQHRKARQIIDRQVRQLKLLVDDLLEVSRITNGRVRLEGMPITVRSVVERAVETVEPMTAQRRHKVTVSLPARDVWLHADAARLEQVVVNLLTNASKYSDEAGQIWVTAALEGDVVALSVRDTGIGIAADLLPHVFNLFTQAERSLDRAQGGLGVGLCLVQRLVELHGGTVEARSVLGRGSEFIVRLPVMASALPFAVPQPFSSAPPLVLALALPAALVRRRVLVVDDSADAANTIKDLLELAGHEVRVANDGYRALEAATIFRPDIVLLDLALPKLSGLEVGRRLRAQPAFDTMLLVAMTGYGHQSARDQTLAAGFDHHLVKPTDVDSLLGILASMGPATPEPALIGALPA